ncbi:hypothetical protein NPIL_287271, partial [Nephila pilipes]
RIIVFVVCHYQPTSELIICFISFRLML